MAQRQRSEHAETFSAENGFDLKYTPATNLDQKSQIDAFTSFVDEGVDVILFSATEGAAGRTHSHGPRRPRSRSS